MNKEAKLSLIARNSVEILTPGELKSLVEKKKQISAYYGTAPTGPYHLAYLGPLSKLVDFQQAGIKTIVLIADIHAALDDLKTPWEQVEQRSLYYKKCIELAVPWKVKPKFILGSNYQLTDRYALDVLKMSSFTTINRAERAASEVTRMKIPKVSELIYPIMQSLDEKYLGIDIQVGGLDQRHIMAFAREYLPKLGYSQHVEIMTPLIASIKGPGTKMSASVPESCIKVYESEDSIRRKIKEAYCPAGELADNSIVQICQYIIFPFQRRIKIAREKKFGGDVVFKNFDELKEEFVNKRLHPLDLKNTVADELIKLFFKVRKYFEKNQDILKELGDAFL